MAEAAPAPARKPETARLFFALWPDGKARSGLEQAGKKLHAACGGRLTRAETLHLTLAFLGDVEVTRIEALRALAAQIHTPAFVMTLTRLGYWRHNRVAWVAPEQTPEALSALAGVLIDALRAADFSCDSRPYAPHITLVRNARCERAALPPFEPLDWPAEEFVLVRSVAADRGVAYEIIGRWPLVAGE